MEPAPTLARSRYIERQGLAPSRPSSNLIDNEQQLRPTVYSPGVVPQALFYQSSLISHTSQHHDELYDVSDDEDSDTSELVPFRVSNSIKKAITVPQRLKLKRLSNLSVIPSPSAWPTIQKLQSKDLPLRVPKSPLSPAALAQLASLHHDPMPARSTTPSLADSTTSADESSFMGSPNPQAADDSVESQWDPPIRLSALARSALSNIRTDMSINNEEDFGAPDDTVEVHEMQDRGKSMAAIFATSPGDDDREPLSAISLPDPAGFISMLPPLGRFGNQTSTSPTLNTSTAERFYGVPWRDGIQQVLDTIEDADEDAEATAAAAASSSKQSTCRNTESSLSSYSGVDCSEVTPRAVEFDAAQVNVVGTRTDFDREYEDKLLKDAASNLSRTSMWLSAQDTYLSAFKSPKPVIVENSTEDKSPVASPVVGPSSPSQEHPPRSSSLSAEQSALFNEAFQYLQDTTSSQDAFIQRRTRADAIQSQRLYLPEKHVAQLLGKFSIDRPSSHSRKISKHLSAEEQKAVEERRNAVARANMERQALQQITLPFWELEARKFIMGGQLIHKAAARQLRRHATPEASTQILDLGGQATASWGWTAAQNYPNAKVFTAIPAAGDIGEASAIQGPPNHTFTAVSNLWTLPFPDNTFTVVSVSALHMMLRTSIVDLASGSAVDEYEATLAEINRVLVPGGILQFQLIDAEVSGDSQSQLVARSIEFAVALRSRGYDPSASTHFIERLDKAGFGNINRTWMKLPFGSSKSKTKDPNGIADESNMKTPTGSTFNVEPPMQSPSIDNVVASQPPELRRRLAWPKANHVLHKISKSPQKRPPVRPLPYVNTSSPPTMNQQLVSAFSPSSSIASSTMTPSVLSPLESSFSPVSDFAEADDVGIESLTGLLGSISWERWMLKLQLETGKTSSQLLEGVADALEEARTSGISAAWTMLFGCAVKK